LEAEVTKAILALMNWASDLMDEKDCGICSKDALRWAEETA